MFDEANSDFCRKIRFKCKMKLICPPRSDDLLPISCSCDLLASLLRLDKQYARLLSGNHVNVNASERVC